MLLDPFSKAFLSPRCFSYFDKIRLAYTEKKKISSWNTALSLWIPVLSRLKIWSNICSEKVTKGTKNERSAVLFTVHFTPFSAEESYYHPGNMWD